MHLWNKSVRLACRPSCVAKTFTLDLARKITNQVCVIPAILIGAMNFYHFIPFSVTLTLAEVTRSA